MQLTIKQALQQGIAAHKQGNHQEAERLYRAILEVKSSHPDANHNLGVIGVAVGKPIEAIPLFKLALESNPKIEQFWLSYVDALIKLEHIDEAEQVLKDAQQAGVSSEKLDALRQQLKQELSQGSEKARGVLSVSEKRTRLAEKKRNERSIKQDASPSQDRIDTLLGHYQAGRLAEAEPYALSLTQEFPSDPFGWKVLGAILLQTGKLAEALLPMRQSVKLMPQDEVAHSNLGVTLQELGQLDEALASFKRAIGLKPGFAEAHGNLGNILKNLGRLDEAEESHRQAVALKPESAKTHFNLGNTLVELGNSTRL